MHDETTVSAEDREGQSEVIEIEIIEDDPALSDAGDEITVEGAEGDVVVDGIEEAGDDVVALKDEVEHLREMYLRKLAEFDNFRKRIERERVEMVKTAGSEVVLDLIPVLDNFERALEHSGDSSPESILQGVNMISKQFLEVLERRGLEQFDPTGEPFQPEIHDAIQRVDDPNLPPGTVAWVLARGYRYGGRLLRPAMVGVTAEETTIVNASKPADAGGGETES
ncbi:MAG: nucleotide exchange factor GrpE [Thermoanaerobaculales bacterium]|nr:nucleotide exchange factor GrpE [Thermoanaerobaculales bacterium]